MTVSERSEVHPDRSAIAQRWVLLGMACSLAFDRFIELYRKYSEDQPRDERGRWVDTGGEEGPETTGSVSPVYMERTGDPSIDTITDKLNAVASYVHDLLGPGEGRLYGIAFHNNFAQRVEMLRIQDLSAEVSYNEGVEVPYGARGSARTDVILREERDGGLSVKAIWDLKTGSAEIYPSRARELRSKVGVGPETPLIEIQINTGIRNKEASDVLAIRAERGELHIPRVARTDHP